MKAYVRRQDIWHTLNRNRYTTVADLAAQYGVSQRTIYYDLQILSLTHPIEAACCPVSLSMLCDAHTISIAKHATHQHSQPKKGEKQT